MKQTMYFSRHCNTSEITLDHRGTFITPLNTQEGTSCDNSRRLNITTRMLHPRSEYGPISAPEINPDRTQTERTQVTQKALSKKATGEKHIETTREKNYSLFILFTRHTSYFPNIYQAYF